VAQDVRDRSRALVEIGIALTSELSLDSVLQRVLEAAATLTEARYAALGVIDASGRSLERFLTTGIDDETRSAIGDLPHGRGILGVLIHHAETLRLHDLHDDPRSVGFPPGHPPMKTFLGVPILLRGIAYGNLYLTEKASGADFTEEDEELDGGLVVGVEVGAAGLLREIEVAVDRPAQPHGHAEERLHRRMVGREADRAFVVAEVVHPQGLRVMNERAEDAAAPGQVADRGARLVVDAARHEAFEVRA